jgi:uncharacterized protein (DUF697 family)
MATKSEIAREWINEYSKSGGAISVAAVVVPGFTTTAMGTILTHLCYQIGKIFKGDEYSYTEAVEVSKLIGLSSITGQLVSLEALNFIPFLGWAAKSVILYGLIKTLGNTIIEHYEKVEANNLVQ